MSREETASAEETGTPDLALSRPVLQPSPGFPGETLHAIPTGRRSACLFQHLPGGDRGISAEDEELRGSGLGNREAREKGFQVGRGRDLRPNEAGPGLMERGLGRWNTMVGPGGGLRRDPGGEVEGRSRREERGAGRPGGAEGRGSGAAGELQQPQPGPPGARRLTFSHQQDRVFLHVGGSRGPASAQHGADSSWPGRPARAPLSRPASALPASPRRPSRPRPPGPASPPPQLPSSRAGKAPAPPPPAPPRRRGGRGAARTSDFATRTLSVRESLPQLCCAPQRITRESHPPFSGNTGEDKLGPESGGRVASLDPISFTEQGRRVPRSVEWLEPGSVTRGGIFSCKNDYKLRW